MKATGIVRPVDHMGRIVLPKPLRDEMNIKRSELLQVSVEGDTVILHLKEKRCAFCGAEQNLICLNRRYCCEKCAEKLGQGIK